MSSSETTMTTARWGANLIAGLAQVVMTNPIEVVKIARQTNEDKLTFPEPFD